MIIRTFLFIAFFIGRTSLALRISAFNVQVYGQTKAGKPEVMSILSKIISRYDIVLIQEIRDSQQTAFPKLVNQVNSVSDTVQYEYLVSERLGRTSSKEQYAFMYRKGVGISVESNVTYDDGVDDGTDDFEREPYLVKFNVQNFVLPVFVLGGIHIKPSEAVAEINALEKVFNFSREYFKTDDVMIMGDLNADCSYVSNSDWTTIPLKQDPNYRWLIGDNVDTTVKATTCAYDRFILHGTNFSSAIVPNTAKAFLYDDEYGLNSTMATSVSDHYPIEFEMGEFNLTDVTTTIDTSNISTIRVAAFNIQVYGQTKAGKPEVMSILVKIVMRYDIVLIQEIRDVAQTAFPKLVDQVNSVSESVQYDYIISERLGRTSSKEQYAFMYRKGVGISVESNVTYDDGVDDGTDDFEREPYLVKFNVTNSAIPVFVLGGIHIKPSEAVAELQALEKVFNFSKEYFKTDDVMIMGDLNADCSYVSNSDWTTIPLKQDPNYHWLIGDDVDSTVKDTTCAYDRFILTGANFLQAVVPNSADVFLYDKEYGLNSTMATSVSDHYPIEFDLTTIYDVSTTPETQSTEDDSTNTDVTTTTMGQIETTTTSSVTTTDESTTVEVTPSTTSDSTTTKDDSTTTGSISGDSTTTKDDSTTTGSISGDSTTTKDDSTTTGSISSDSATTKDDSTTTGSISSDSTTTKDDSTTTGSISSDSTTTKDDSATTVSASSDSSVMGVESTTIGQTLSTMNDSVSTTSNSTQESKSSSCATPIVFLLIFLFAIQNVIIVSLIA